MLLKNDVRDTKLIWFDVWGWVLWSIFETTHKHAKEQLGN